MEVFLQQIFKKPLDITSDIKSLYWNRDLCNAFNLFILFIIGNGRCRVGDAPDDTGTRGRRYALGWNGAADRGQRELREIAYTHNGIEALVTLELQNDEILANLSIQNNGSQTVEEVMFPWVRGLSEMEQGTFIWPQFWKRRYDDVFGKELGGDHHTWNELTRKWRPAIRRIWLPLGATTATKNMGWGLKPGIRIFPLPISMFIR
ncbi:MAG: hypothetical protein ACOX45_09315 [Acutalibacteraceae bacterium]